jgi:hypothetical protein
VVRYGQKRLASHAILTIKMLVSAGKYFTAFSPYFKGNGLNKTIFTSSDPQNVVVISKTK